MARPPAGQRARRRFSALLALGTLLPWTTVRATPPTMEVWTSTSCSCCKDWIAYLEKNGFVVKGHESGNTQARARAGLPSKYGSCHTGIIDGYVVEGHVPVREIRRLLQERPDAVGIAVPAMPIGSPGMDGPAYGNKTEPYSVILVTRDGKASIYASYP